MSVKASALLLGVLLALSVSYCLTGRPSKKDGLYPQGLGMSAPCPGKAETLTATDDVLPGIVHPGQKLKIIWNWYACHAPKRGEIALVRISRDLPPKVKVIRAVSGDALLLKQDKSKVRWNLFINGRVVLDDQNIQYAFGGKSLPPIGQYIKAQGPMMGPRDVIVLSTRSPGDFDSGLFGVIGVADLIARVELE